MNKEFIPYEEALALKELGFGASPIGSTNGGSVFYYENGKLYYDGRPMYSSDYHSGQILAPLYQQAFRWFREKGYDIKIQKESFGLYFGFYWTGVAWINVDSGSYEEVELACLKKLIEIIKSQKNEHTSKF